MSSLSTYPLLVVAEIEVPGDVVLASVEWKVRTVLQENGWRLTAIDPVLAFPGTLDDLEDQLAGMLPDEQQAGGTPRPDTDFEDEEDRPPATRFGNSAKL